MENEADKIESDLSVSNPEIDSVNDIHEEISKVTNQDDASALTTDKNQKLRFGLLFILISGSLIVLGRSLIDGNMGKPNLLVFPERIEFAKDQISPSETNLSETIMDNKSFYGKPKYLAGKSYKYLLDKKDLDIDFRYVIGTDGDLPLLIKELTNIEIGEDKLRKSILRKEPVGYYAAFTYKNRVYLTACINSRGISTVTKEQFEDNASDRAMDRDVIIDWLLGTQDLRDRRCLWTLISTPLTADSNLNDTNQKLEKIWISWYEWWKPRFPKP